ncbi:Uncharacterized protein TPS_01495 [Trichinella pseudospiralis]
MVDSEESEPTRFVKEGRTGRGRKRSRQKSPRQSSDGIALANEQPGTARSRNSDLSEIRHILHKTAYTCMNNLSSVIDVQSSDAKRSLLSPLYKFTTPLNQHCPRDAASRIQKQTRCHTSLIAVSNAALSDWVSADLQKHKKIESTSYFKLRVAVPIITDNS